MPDPAIHISIRVPCCRHDPVLGSTLYTGMVEGLCLCTITLGPLLQKKRCAASGLHVVSPMSRSLCHLGEALFRVWMPLVFPPHSMMLMQLVLNCTCQFYTLLPASSSPTSIFSILLAYTKPRSHAYAVLCCAALMTLCCANHAVLCWRHAVLCCAALCCAVLCCAVLTSSKLFKCILCTTGLPQQVV